MERVVDGARHGTISGYDHDKCRCRPCRNAAALQQRVRYRRAILKQPGTFTSSIGTRRRIRALARLGWPAHEVAARSGMTESQVLRAGRKDRIRRETAEKIRVAYDEMSMRLGPNRHLSLWAAARGYAPPLAWDDIDDPDEVPQGEKHIYTDLIRRLPDTDRLVAEVNRSGVVIVAERYKVTPGAINKALARRGYRAVTRSDQNQLPTYMRGGAA